MPNKTDVQEWAKAELKEMDGKIASLQSKLGQLNGDARTKVESALAAMRNSRDAFQQALRKAGESAQDNSAHAKASLDAHLSEFKASAKKAFSHADDSTKDEITK